MRISQFTIDYMSNRTWLDMVKNCVISEISRTPETEGANPVDETLTTGATFQINNAKLYVQLLLCILMIISIF